jgi:hypothetical protein
MLFLILFYLILKFFINHCYSSILKHFLLFGKILFILIFKLYFFLFQSFYLNYLISIIVYFFKFNIYLLTKVTNQYCIQNLVEFIIIYS